MYKLVVAGLVFLVLVFAAGLTTTVAQSQVPNKIKIYSKVSPEMVALLKKQAEEQKLFYAAQSIQLADLKRNQAKEKDSLVDTHRVGRNAFTLGQHTRQERKDFFKNQREQMNQLRIKQKDEKVALQKTLKQQLIDFHAKQSQQQQDLRQKVAGQSSGQSHTVGSGS